VARYNQVEDDFDVRFNPNADHLLNEHDNSLENSIENEYSIATTSAGATGDHSQHIASRVGQTVEDGATRNFFLAVWNTLKEVFSKKLAKTTSLLWIIWFANATTYYGLVLLTTTLQAADSEEGNRCTDDGEAAFTTSDYTAVFVTSLAEAPGLLIAALLIDSKGRLWCLRLGMSLCSVCILLLLLNGGKVLQLVLLFCSRACVEGTFSILYVYTPELYPTEIRSFGLALCNGFARLGGFMAPFATVYLVESGQTIWSVIALGSLCTLATVATVLLPIETMGKDLQADLEVEDESPCTTQENLPLVTRGMQDSSEQQ